jgi:hypothetical protein
MDLLARREKNLIIAQNEFIGDLRSSLTPGNVAAMLEQYYPKIYFAEVRVKVRHVASWREIVGEKDFTIWVKCPASHLERVLDLLRIVYPRLVPRNDRDLIDSGSQEYYQIVSATKYASVAGRRSPVEEDNINDYNEYAVYILHHNVALMSTHVFGDDRTFDSFRRSCPYESREAIKRWLDGCISRNHGWMPEASTLQDDYDQWADHFRCAMWCNLHPRMLTLCITLAPLRLTPYVILWILDWIPPMNFKHYDSRHRPYDINHLSKLRLIEGVTRSYAKLR